VVREESLDNAVRALRQLKELGIFPGLITCDFSPNLIGAIKQVYGADVIQIDLFHVMQELNRGIKADLYHYRERQFDAERRELCTLRNWINALQKAIVGGSTISSALKGAGSLPVIVPSHEMSTKCARFTSTTLELLKLNAPTKFFRELRTFLGALNRLEEPQAYVFDRLLKLIPKHRFTKKGMFRAKQELLKKAKTYSVWHRHQLDDKSVQFYREMNAIFFQPEHLTIKRQDLLTSLITTHPELSVYRTMTLLVGELSRRPLDEINGHQIDDLCECPTFSKKLNAAIKTIKKHKDDILRFVPFFKNHPELLKAHRSNMEYQNKKFKHPFEAGNNLLKKERVLGRLHVQLSGKVEWYLEEEVVI